MTKRELIELLDGLPDDAPIFDGRNRDLQARHVRTVPYDDWQHATQDGENDIPAVGSGVAFGPRF